MTVSPLADRATLAAHLAVMPVEGGLGVTPIEARPGYLRARIPVPTRADGRIPGVVLAVAADCGVGVAVNSSVPGVAAGPTVELRVDLVGEPFATSGELRIEGTALYVGTTFGIGRAEITDHDSGALIGHATGVMAVGRASAESAAPLEGGHRLDPSAIGVVPVAGEPGAAMVALAPGMLNSMGHVHGGVMTAIAGRAQELLREPGVRAEPISLTVEFLRPAPLALGLLNCRSSFVRQGYRFSTVRTEIVRPEDGVPVAVATGTAVLGVE
ncbi:acyl-CoA thioesterase domain-containing protein [Cryptosporangium sp. NPDC051539]|uniref:acyl-CoA thioesterase domain-containing protein n=1 Tax=Cryptosporangium sp. NPDC051539 TaxID=3363962 RepID=UPI0037A7B068